MIRTLDHALDRLLHDGDLRRRFAAGEAVFSLDADDAEALAGVDMTQLEGMAAMLRERVWRASHRGGTTLAETFSEAVAAWTRAHPDDRDHARLVEGFVASEAFEAHRAVGRAGLGPCVEEAFASWCARENIGDASARERALMAAVARALTVCPEPDFTVPQAFRRVPGGWCAVLDGDAPTLYAAVQGRCMTGPVTPLVARLLHGEAPDGEGAPVADELRAMGLL
ncbi:MAG: hypothetical protein U0326_23835 [Polyangiales bacterium]